MKVLGLFKYILVGAVFMKEAPLLKIFSCRSLYICTIQYNTVLSSTIQYITVQYSTIQYNTVQYSTVQYSTIKLPDSVRGDRTCFFDSS